MITAKMKLTDAIRHIDAGIETELKKEIKKALMVHAESVVEEVATKLCSNLKGNLTAFEKFETDQIVISLIINGIPKNIKEEKE